MVSLETTRMSSKGQVVIPEAIRNQLHLQPGTQFVVVGDRDVVILKLISPPSLDKFGDLMATARRQAKKAGLEPADVDKAIRRVRGRK